MKIDDNNVKIQKGMRKKILECSGCRYFPVSLQLEKYFLNSDTFKCPVCEELTLFDRKEKCLLEEQFYAEIKEKQARQRNRVEEETKKQINQEQKKREDKEKVVMIWVQENDQYREDFYLNPINTKLMNSFNIDKSQILSQKTHPIFELNHQFIQKLIINQPIQTRNQINPLRYGKRKVTKAEHLSYSIDQYIQKIALIFNQKQTHNQDSPKLKQITNLDQPKDSQQNQNIKFFICTVKNKNQLNPSNVTLHENQLTQSQMENNQIQKSSQLQSFSQLYTITHSLSFSLKTYQSFSLQNQTSTDQNAFASNQTKNTIIKDDQQKQSFAQQVKKFLSKLYCVTSKDKLLDQKQTPSSYQGIDTLFSTLKDANIAIMTLFSHSPNFQLLSSLIKQTKPYLPTNRFQHFFTHHFYLTSSTQTNQKQLISFQTLNLQESQFDLFYSSLYIPFYKKKTSCQHVIETLINVSLKRIFMPPQINESNRKGKVTQKQMRKTVSDQSDEQKQALVFWHLENNSQNDEQKQPIKSDKILLKSLMGKISTKMDRAGDNVWKRQLEQSIKPELIKTISNRHKIKHSSDIILDRMSCDHQQQRIYYVFNFESIIKINYEQLDFLDEYSLPQQLKDYAKTYHHESLKKPAPFKKALNRVFLVQEQNYCQNQPNFRQDFQDDSDERESL